MPLYPLNKYVLPNAGKRLSRLADMFAEEALVGLKKQKAVKNLIKELSEVADYLIMN